MCHGVRCYETIAWGCRHDKPKDEFCMNSFVRCQLLPDKMEQKKKNEKRFRGLIDEKLIKNEFFRAAAFIYLIKDLSSLLWWLTLPFLRFPHICWMFPLDHYACTLEAKTPFSLSTVFWCSLHPEMIRCKNTAARRHNVQRRNYNETSNGPRRLYSEVSLSI